MLNLCFEKAKEVLKGNGTKAGITAGKRYPDVWGRDGLISSLGMSSSGDKELVGLAEVTINSISRHQRKTGQLPNKISPKDDRVCFGEGGCVDTALWYPIAVLTHYKNTGDVKFLKFHLPKIERAMVWLTGLDQNGDGLIETNEGSDWMDCLLRSGRVLYDEVLFYAALRATDRIRSELKKGEKYPELSELVKKSINLLFWPEEKNRDVIQSMWGHTGIERDFEAVLKEGTKNYYYAELGLRRFDPRCDVYANILAILFDVADEKKKKIVFDHFDKEKVYEPYPVKVLWPPIRENDSFRFWHFRPVDFSYLQNPGNYHNGGIWTYVGGFYAMALSKEGKNAEQILERMAMANRLGLEKEWEFNEWLDKDGKIGFCRSADGKLIHRSSSNQSWSAGMYILAYQEIKTKGVLE